MKRELKSSEGGKINRIGEKREIDGWIREEFQGRKMKREDREEDSASIRIHQNPVSFTPAEIHTQPHR